MKKNETHEQKPLLAYRNYIQTPIMESTFHKISWIDMAFIWRFGCYLDVLRTFSLGCMRNKHIHTKEIHALCDNSNDYVNVANILSFPADIYLLKVNIENTRTRCETCSKLTIKLTPCSNDFIVNFEHVIAGWVVVTPRNARKNISS